MQCETIVDGDRKSLYSSETSILSLKKNRDVSLSINESENKWVPLTDGEKESKAFCRLFCYWISRRRDGRRTDGVKAEIKYDIRLYSPLHSM